MRSSMVISTYYHLHLQKREFTLYWGSCSKLRLEMRKAYKTCAPHLLPLPYRTGPDQTVSLLMGPASETGAMVQVGEGAPAHTPLLEAAGIAVFKAFKGYSPRCQSCIQIKLPCLQREETHHHTLNNHLEIF